MVRIDVVNLPSELRPHDLNDRAVAVFDVLRATTSMIAALHSGAKEILIFDSLDELRRQSLAGLRCGEQRCRKPADFDLGNSPAEFLRLELSGKSLLMCTTNGTRAIAAAQSAAAIFVASIVNASAVARRLIVTGRDVTLLCAGTDGEFSVEDFLGAGATIDAMRKSQRIECTALALDAQSQFVNARSRLAEVFRAGQGGHNLIAAGLEGDIDFAAQLDRFEDVGEVRSDPLRVEKQ